MPPLSALSVDASAWAETTHLRTGLSTVVSGLSTTVYHGKFLGFHQFMEIPGLVICYIAIWKIWDP
jgi:hypothetical protein